MRTITVKVIPRSKHSSVEVASDGTYVVRTTAVPDSGKANAATIALLAAHLQVAKSAICIVRGHTSRHKVCTVV